MRVRPPKELGEQTVAPADHDPFTVAYPDWHDAPDEVARQLSKQGWELDKKAATKAGRDD